MRQGATWLGVAQLHEALRLREYLDAAGVKPVDAAQLAQNPALATAQTPRIFTWIMPPVSAQEAAQADSGLRQALRAQLDLSASTVEVLQAIIAAAQAEGKCAYVHLKVDTGMARAGANLEDLADLAQCAAQAQSQGHIKVVALWSHLARADEILIPATGQQLERYRQGLQILADAGKLGQVLATLIENSLRYGDGMTRVWAHAGSSKRGVIIEVSDEGEGIDEALAPDIFEKGVSGHGSTGIGLALAHDLAQAMGGRLELKSNIPPVFTISVAAIPASLDPDRVMPEGPLISMGRRSRRF